MALAPLHLCTQGSRPGRRLCLEPQGTHDHAEVTGAPSEPVGRVLTVTGTATLPGGPGAREWDHWLWQSQDSCAEAGRGPGVQASVPHVWRLPCAAERLGTFFRAVRSQV